MPRILTSGVRPTAPVKPSTVDPLEKPARSVVGTVENMVQNEDFSNFLVKSLSMHYHALMAMAEQKPRGRCSTEVQRTFKFNVQQPRRLSARL